MTIPDQSVFQAVTLALLASIATGAVCGFLNGWISAFWGLPSFIVTLGMLNIARGGALQVTDARTIYSFPQSFNDFGSIMIFGVPVVFLIALALALIAWVILSKTVLADCCTA